MSYQVLARKWRPKSFAQMQGQAHILRALTNALDQQRLHHAYLFTGSRGIGKTTVARILAKCLNCEQGISAKPCEQCSHCTDINAGRFIDLIEIDAASRTRVEDTRDLLDNVPYAPTKGRYKIYLIDEVHMLSGHSFNALLKTLEEPPEHVKFLLATTDPQKLPVTVLSRCLQFHLKLLPADSITTYLQDILKQEKIPAETPALEQIARSAQGSMRDALSLLDQAIAFGGGSVRYNEVCTMLGTVERRETYDLLEALVQQNGAGALAAIDELTQKGADHQIVLSSLIETLHKIAICQALPEAIAQDNDQPIIQAFAQQLTAELVQLYYQIALVGQKDLTLAPDTKLGLEMVVLRMLAFYPVKSVSVSQPQQIAVETHEARAIAPKTTPAKAKSKSDAAEEKATASDSKPMLTPQALNAGSWNHVVPQLNLAGVTHMIISHSAFASFKENCLSLVLSPKYAAMLNEKNQKVIEESLCKTFDSKIRLEIQINEPSTTTPMEYKLAQEAEARAKLLEKVKEDPNIQRFEQAFGAKIQPSSLKVTI